jgi:hypothetical protein
MVATRDNACVMPSSLVVQFTPLYPDNSNRFTNDSGMPERSDAAAFTGTVQSQTSYKRKTCEEALASRTSAGTPRNAPAMESWGKGRPTFPQQEQGRPEPRRE